MVRFSCRGIIYALVILLGLAAAMPNLLPLSAQRHLPDWYTGQQLALGLDLQGGSHLLFDADASTVYRKAVTNLSQGLQNTLRDNHLRYTGLTQSETQLSLRVTSQADAEQVIKLAYPMLSGPDNHTIFQSSQDQLTINFTLLPAGQKLLLDNALEQALEVVRRRLNETGLTEPTVTRQGDGILVQMPGVSDPTHIRNLLGTTAKMDFYWVSNATTTSIQLPQSDGQGVLSLTPNPALAGEHITDARLAFDPQTTVPVVSFSLDNTGARQFGQMTSKHIGDRLAIVLDNQIITAPVIQSAITAGSGQITGNFTVKEATNLALMLRAGALPVPLQVIEERTVGPDVGSDAIKLGIASSLAGAVLVLITMVALYRRWGVTAGISLVVNMLLLLGLLSLFGATLTLPGFAGIILTLGMAVDANILINERIREQTMRGAGAAVAIKNGFTSAWTTILDANFTTLIAVSLLFMFGSGPVKGFAVTIGIGLLTSMFTAVTLTRGLMEWQIRRTPRAKLNLAMQQLMQRIGQSSTNYIKGRVIGLTASLILSLGSVALFVSPGLNYGVDFTGGTLVEVHSATLSVDTLRNTLSEHGLNQATIQEFEQAGEYLVKLPVAPQATSSVDKPEALSVLRQSLAGTDSDASIVRVDMVGPKVSSGFTDVSILAVLLAGMGVVGYLWLRFESHFALAATATIALDITKTIGFFALTGLEFNLTAVAALLALIGYSINDKVVVFDRIRETLRHQPQWSLPKVINSSISATLGRTIMTSVTTLIALLPMALAGGQTVASFAWPMIFGIVVGTSSTLFVAVSLFYFLADRRQQKGLAQLRPSAAQMKEMLADIP